MANPNIGKLTGCEFSKQKRALWLLVVHVGQPVSRRSYLFASAGLAEPITFLIIISEGADIERLRSFNSSGVQFHDSIRSVVVN